MERSAKHSAGSSPERVLLAVGPLPPPINGLSQAFAHVAKEMGPRGWKVEVVDAADRSPPRAGSSFSWSRSFEVVRVFRQVVSRLRRADVVYVTIAQSRLGFAKDLLILGAAFAAKRPVVIHMHGGNFGGFYAGLTVPEQLVVRTALARVQAIVVLTESLRADFKMSPSWERQTVAIANACEGSTGAVRNHPGQEWRLLFLSNLLPSKGYRETLLAAAELGRQRPSLRVTLALAGDLVPEQVFPSKEAQREDLDALMRSLPPNVRAEYKGIVTGPEKRTLFSSSDVFLLPTDYVNEGQPIAIIEAMRAGLPVIATAWRGIPETVSPAMRELLLSARDVSAISAKLTQLADTPQLYDAQSAESLRHGASFTLDRHLDALNDVLLSAAAAVSSLPSQGLAHVE